jgi:putative FmdB family regulatory protein
MPLYEYKCENCGQRFELIQKFSDPLADTCPKCGGGPVHKLMSSPAIQFKGSGWYITDYAKKDSGAAAKPETSDASAKSDTSDAKTGKKTDEKKTAKAESSASPTKPAADPAK